MKISLNQQIEEVRVLMRGARYPAGTSSGVRDYHRERGEAAIATLKWLQTHEEVVRSAVRSEGTPTASGLGTPTGGSNHGC